MNRDDIEGFNNATDDLIVSQHKLVSGLISFFMSHFELEDIDDTDDSDYYLTEYIHTLQAIGFGDSDYKEVVNKILQKINNFKERTGIINTGYIFKILYHVAQATLFGADKELFD